MKGERSVIVVCPKCAIELKATPGRSKNGTSTTYHAARRIIQQHARSVHPDLGDRQRSMLADEAAGWL